MTEDPPMIRHWNSLRILGARYHGITVGELAGELGVTEETIRRDLDFFRDQCVPLECVTGERGRKAYRLGEGWRRPPMAFTFEEATALYLGRQSLEPLAGTPFWSAAQDAWRKIRSTLGETPLKYLDRFPRMFRAAGEEVRQAV